MRNRKLATLALSAAAMGGLVLTAPGAGADTCVAGVGGCSTTGTVATFELTAAGGLSLSTPDGDSTTPVDLGTGATGDATLTGSLGDVTVTDQRGSLVAAWVATVSTTDFTTGGGSTNETVASPLIAYTSGSPTNDVTGYVGTFTPSVSGLTLGAAGTAGAWAGVGNNAVTWNPSLTFTLLPSQVAGVYEGTVTHSIL